ncbi:MAG: hypothetical protein DDG58_04255 [Ardenticatenia bacterium]|nr:MAG: hypothetical protein DDG58_04255 [Ardenticatenia bacterium]
MIERILTKGGTPRIHGLWQHLRQAEYRMAERDYRERYAMHSMKARKQLVHPYHKLGSIRATART